MATSEPAKDWVTSARKIYSPALNVIFADPFYDLGWLSRTESEAGPTTATLAQAAASPGTQSTPAMRLGQADSLPAPELRAEGETATAATPAAATTTASTTTAAIASTGSNSTRIHSGRNSSKQCSVGCHDSGGSGTPVVQPKIQSTPPVVAKATPLPVTHPAASAGCDGSPQRKCARGQNLLLLSESILFPIHARF